MSCRRSCRRQPIENGIETRTELDCISDHRSDVCSLDHAKVVVTLRTFRSVQIDEMVRQRGPSLTHTLAHHGPRLSVYLSVTREGKAAQLRSKRHRDVVCYV